MRQLAIAGTNGATTTLVAGSVSQFWRAPGPWTIYVKGASTNDVTLQFRPDASESWGTFAIDVSGTKTDQIFDGAAFADVQRYRFEEGEFRLSVAAGGSPTVEAWVGGKAYIVDNS